MYSTKVYAVLIYILYYITYISVQRIQICHAIFENNANFADRFPLLKPHHLRLQAALSTNLPLSTPSPLG